MRVEMQNPDTLRIALGDFADDRIGDAVIAAEGDGKRAGIYNLAYALADAVKGQSVITVAAYA